MILYSADGEAVQRGREARADRLSGREPSRWRRIPGTGGVCKIRFAASGRGKRGEARVIYYYLDDTMPLYALLAYAKNAKDDMSPEEKRMVVSLAAALKAAWKERK